MARWWFLTMIGRLQVLVIDRVVARAPGRAPSYGESPAAAAAPSDAPWQATSTALRLTVAALLAAATRDVARSSAPVRPCDTSRDEKMRVPSERVANASIPRSMPVSCPVAGKRLYWHIRAGEADVPAVRLSADRDRLGRAFQRATDQRTAMRPILERTRKPLSSVGAVAKLLVGEASCSGSLPGSADSPASRPSRIRAEERLEGSVQPGQHILQDLRVDVAVFGPDLLDSGQLGALAAPP